MPQMMPMMWLYMLIFNVTLLMFFINFMYFFYTPYLKSSKFTPRLLYWSWVW